MEKNVSKSLDVKFDAGSRRRVQLDESKYEESESASSTESEDSFDLDESSESSEETTESEESDESYDEWESSDGEEQSCEYLGKERRSANSVCSEEDNDNDRVEAENADTTIAIPKKHHQVPFDEELDEFSGNGDEKTRYFDSVRLEISKMLTKKL